MKFSTLVYSCLFSLLLTVSQADSDSQLGSSIDMGTGKSVVKKKNAQAVDRGDGGGASLAKKKSFQLGDRIDVGGMPVKGIIKEKIVVLHEGGRLKLYYLDADNRVITPPIKGAIIHYYDLNEKGKNVKKRFESRLTPNMNEPALVGECGAVDPYRYVVIGTWVF